MSVLLKAIVRTVALATLLSTVCLAAQRQSSQPAPPQPAGPAIQNLEHRIDLVEEHARYLEELAKSNIDANRFLVTVLTIIVTLVIGLQGIFQGLILRHQWNRDSERDTRDKEKESFANAGAKAVSEVLSVVKDTMDTRLIQEKKAIDEANTAKLEVQTIRGDLARVVAHFERLARTTHDRIESLALQLAKVRRHDFKETPNRLIDFAQQYDDYKSNLQPLAPSELKFTARVAYARGIAAHYMSEPGLVKTYLTDVVSRNQPELGETEFEHTRRLANAYYYLGVNESNFANYVDALRLLERANGLDPDSRDLLTRIVTAECYIFSDQLERAKGYIESDIDASIEDMKKRDDFRSYHVPLQSRAELMKANVAILEGSDDWPTRVKSLLEPVCTGDPDSYYALFSLAQAYHFSGDKRAADLFDKAYECMVRRRHLDTSTEVRSRILLLMVAGLCSRMGSHGVKKRKPEEFLEEAKSLLDRLPRRDSEESTAFSPITKRNEDKNTLATHIGQIQSGVVIQAKGRAHAATA